MPGDQTVGKKLQCADCGNQIVVIRPSATEFTCCGETMSASAGQGRAAATS